MGFETRDMERKVFAIMKTMHGSDEPQGARVTGIPYLMEAYREEAMEILGS